MSNYSHSKSRPSRPIYNHQSLGSQSRKLEHLALRVVAATEPPISEIQVTFQTHLSSETIPADKDVPNAKDIRAVQLALLASGVLAACGFHSVEASNSAMGSCLLKAWPGIWSWLKFLDEKCCQRTKFGDTIKSHALLVIPGIIHNITRPEAVQRQTVSMPAMTNMKTRYAKMGSHPQTKAASGLAINAACWDSRNARHPETKNPLGRAQGDVPADTNAQVAVKMLDDLLAGQSFDLEVARKCISSVSKMARLASSSPQRKRTMLDQGIIPATVKTLLWLEKNGSVTPAHQDMASQCVRMCYDMLWDVLVIKLACTGASWVIQALDAGLLLAITKSAFRNGSIGKNISSRCSQLLYVVALQLMYKSVVRSTAKALTKVDESSFDITSESFLFDAWDQFKTLSQQRIATKKRMEQDQCDHGCNLPSCFVMVKRDELLSCGGCLSATYCSKPCQRTHWATHKAQCKESRGVTQNGDVTPLTPGEHSFIGRIAFDDIHNINALVAYVKACQEHRGSELAFSLNYATIPMEITVVPVGEMHTKVQCHIDGLDEKSQQGDSKANIIAEAVTVRGGALSIAVFRMHLPMLKILSTL
ncbi:hypothetical protein HWV62_13773 [Athelia sp. TMB]|nr:hypothetical protein HWV62_13773 [Athelia sp. TMB]